MLATLPTDDTAAECAAAMTRPADYLRAAQYNPHAEVFQRLSRAQVSSDVPVGIIESISRAKDGTWLYAARCPHCRGRHRHGGGNADLPWFGMRVADCHGGDEYALMAVAAEVSA